jgi:hypothetical protein
VLDVQEPIYVIDGTIRTYSPSWDIYFFLREISDQIPKLAAVVERAEQYDVEFVTRAIYALSSAKRRLDELQSPTFGPN